MTQTAGPYDPRNHACAICAAPAAYGYGYPGNRLRLPADKQGRLWVCKAHRDEADRRMRAAIGVGAGAVDSEGGKGTQIPPMQRRLFD